MKFLLASLFSVFLATSAIAGNVPDFFDAEGISQTKAAELLTKHIGDKAAWDAAGASDFLYDFFNGDNLDEGREGGSGGPDVDE